jgi:hypothetical protein
MSEVTSIIEWIKEFGFSIAVAVYLLWERTNTFKESQKRYEDLQTIVIDIVKQNTVAFVEMKATIEKLCELVNGKPKP